MSNHGHIGAYKSGCLECQEYGRVRRRAWRAKNPEAQKAAVAKRMLKAKETPAHKIPHGLNGYVNYVCRCGVCTAAGSAAAVYHAKKFLGKAKLLSHDLIPHGKGGYHRYGCRCSVCTLAVREDHRAWREKNKDHVRTEHNAYLRQRRKNDPSYKIVANLRTRLTSLLRRGKATKCVGTVALLGCDAPHLRAHLEAAFHNGMSWDNYGEWHVDHKRPCASFDVRNPEHLRQCFHYTNLQPLWAHDNCAKGAKVVP